MDRKDRCLLLGVTGGIATGKSTVAEMLEEMGAPLVDVDIIAREVVEPGRPAWKQIVGYFGDSVLKEDGSIDRKRLSSIVFNDEAKRKRLESFTHPFILEEMAGHVDRIARNNPDAIIQVVVPLLIEIGSQNQFDKVVLVYAPGEVQIERLMRRDGIERTQAERILEAQLPIDEKLKYADFVIYNDGTLDETRTQVEDLWRELKDIQQGRSK
ncbi:MAG: dephospho-CoA kinase [Deltaproteobacteria bacterium]|nr:dephospho-CoA kinase [Deltaproteobacteria bacterium]